MLSWLFAEIRRPCYRRLLIANAITLVLAIFVAVAFVVPLRHDVAALKQSQLALAQSATLNQQLQDAMPQITRMQKQLPTLVEKQGWQGSSAEFSRAVLDAGTRADVVLQKELNASRQRGDVTVYSKVLNFDAEYATLMAFLQEVSDL